MYASALKEKLRKREMTVGTWMTFDFWPGYVELYKQAGADCIVLDLEHGSGGFAVAEEICRIGRLIDMPIVLRAEASVYHVLRRYMDMGPSGFMLPWVEREEQIRTLEEATFCAPQGRRGPGGVSIFGVSGFDREGWAEVERNFAIMLQVETPAGIESMQTIMDKDWIDSVVLGPYDLSLNMGHCGEMTHPEVVAAITRVIRQADEIGKPCGMPVGSVEDARFWAERGSTFMIYGEATMAARAGLTNFIGALNAGE